MEYPHTSTKGSIKIFVIIIVVILVGVGIWYSRGDGTTPPILPQLSQENVSLTLTNDSETYTLSDTLVVLHSKNVQLNFLTQESPSWLKDAVQRGRFTAGDVATVKEIATVSDADTFGGIALGASINEELFVDNDQSVTVFSIIEGENAASWINAQPLVNDRGAIRRPEIYAEIISVGDVVVHSDKLYNEIILRFAFEPLPTQ